MQAVDLLTRPQTPVNNIAALDPGYGFALTVLLAPLLAVYSVDWAQHVVHAVNTQAELRDPPDCELLYIVPP